MFDSIQIEQVIKVTVPKIVNQNGLGRTIYNAKLILYTTFIVANFYFIE